MGSPVFRCNSEKHYQLYLKFLSAAAPCVFY